MNVDRKLMATTTVQTPKSSIKSSSSMAEDYRCCSTGCRRDANCKCDVCIESFNLTFDLLPISVQRSSLSKLSSSKPPSPPETPIFCNPSTISTPESDDTCRLMVSPPLNSTLRTDFRRKINRRKVEFGYCVMMMRLFLVLLCLILIGKFGVSVFNSGVVRTKLTSEMVRNLDLSEKSQVFHERLEFLDGGKLQDVDGVGVLESSSTNPNWEIVQDGLILRSHCQLYKSEMEEVSSIWGWPWQTAGLLTNKFASRSLTILSGRLTEWSNGESSCSIRKANTSSWEQEKWSALLWRLDENTWILEYKRSFVFDNTNPFSSAMELLKFGMMSTVQWMKQLWRFSSGFVDGNHLTPT